MGSESVMILEIENKCYNTVMTIFEAVAVS